VTQDPRALGGAWRQHQRHEFTPPPPDLAPFVSRFWTVEWEYAEPYRQLIVPYPHVDLVVRTGHEPEISGVASRHVIKELAGSGRVVGAQFRPGGFRAFLGHAVAALTDRTVPATSVLPAPPRVPADVASMEAWLRAARPQPDAVGAWAAGVVERVAADPSVARVDQLAARHGCGVRHLQRVFAEYVGVGPKWVIRRYRLREVTERMSDGAAIDWAGLAADLGYADQAHLTRDFTSIFGEPPTRYARRYASR
jgi:AraC-like DNA-binding protein